MEFHRRRIVHSKASCSEASLDSKRPNPESTASVSRKGIRVGQFLTGRGREGSGVEQRVGDEQQTSGP